MHDDDDDLAATEWRIGFQRRLREIQGARLNGDMADLLGIDPSTYSKYVSNRMSQPPIRLLPKLAKIGAVSLEYLITGVEKSAGARQTNNQPRKRAARAQ